MFDRAWTWLVPLIAAAAAFGGVLSTTPPGWRAIPQVLIGSVRGPNADAAAYALGAAASLALLVLLGLMLLVALVRALTRRRHQRP